MKKIPCLLHRAARRAPHRTFLVQGGTGYNYREAEARVHALSKHLEVNRIRRGTHVGVIPSDPRAAIIAILAVMRRGAVACLDNPRNPPEQCRKHFRAVGSKHILQFEGQRISCGRTSKTIRINEYFSAKVPFDGLRPFFDEEQLVTATFTSGTTGTPKAVVLTYGNHYYNALGSNTNIELDPDDGWLLSLPLYHVSGLGIIFRCLLAMATICVPEKNTTIAQAIDRYPVTHLSVVECQLRQLMKKSKTARRLATMKAVLVGGGPLDPVLIRRCLDKNIPIHVSYGLSEMASQVTTTSPEDRPHRMGSAGRVLPYREIKLDAAEEILVRGKTLFAGYLNDGKLQRGRMKKGWFLTGDRGSMDKDKYLVVYGRRDGMFISGGENIYPEEIENALEGMPEIRRAVILAVKCAHYGRRPAAVVQCVGEKPRVKDRLIRLLMRRLPKFKIPDRFYIWPEGYSPSGSRRSVREDMAGYFKRNKTDFRKMA